MDRGTLRHIMAAIIVADELRVPNVRTGDPYMNDERLQKQFNGMVENAYCLADLMLGIGDRRELPPGPAVQEQQWQQQVQQTQQPQQDASQPQGQLPPQQGGPLY